MKLLLKLGAVGIALLVLLVVVGALALNPVLRRSIERGATLATGTPTTLGSVEVGLLSGKLQLDELAIQNPEGFRDEPFFALSSGRVEVHPAALLDSTLDIPVIAFDGLALNVERAGGRTNYGEILDNLARMSGPEVERTDPPTTPDGAPPAGGDEPPSTERTLRIGRVSVTNVRASVHLDLGLTTTSNTLELPPLELDGFESTGTQDQNVARLTRAIVRALLGSVADSGGLPADLAADLRGELKDFGALLRGEGDGFRESVERAGRDVGKNVEDAVQELKGALGGG